MKNRFNIIVKHILFALMIFLSTASLFGQTITPKKLEFEKICADNDFNTFKAAFIISGFPVGTTFVVVLSDPTGDFITSIATVPLPNDPLTTPPDSATDKTLTFAIPTTLIGSETYRLRVKSSTAIPVTSSDFTSAAGVKAFSAYFKVQNEPFSINNFNSTATYCLGGSCVLLIDNPGTSSNNSPLKYPSLTYRWYKEGSLVPVATTTSLTVNQPGKYYVETNYGSCTSNSYSNRVTVSESSSTAVATIISSLGNPFCSSAGSTTLSTVEGNSYQWYKNSGAIMGATNQTYETNEVGQYSVAVSFGDCVASASINLQDFQFTSSINVPDTNTISPGETLVVAATTTALNPVYKWYLNDAVILDAVESTYMVKTKGTYKVVITQTSGCVESKEFIFVVNETVDSNPFPDVINIPNLISPNGDGINDNWIIPQEYVSGTNTEVILISSLGEIVLKTNGYQNNWPENSADFKNVNPVYYYIITTPDKKVKKGSITVIK